MCILSYSVYSSPFPIVLGSHESLHSNQGHLPGMPVDVSWLCEQGELGFHDICILFFMVKELLRKKGYLYW